MGRPSSTRWAPPSSCAARTTAASRSSCAGTHTRCVQPSCAPRTPQSLQTTARHATLPCRSRASHYRAPAGTSRAARRRTWASQQTSSSGTSRPAKPTRRSSCTRSWCERSTSAPTARASSRSAARTTRRSCCGTWPRVTPSAAHRQVASSSRPFASSTSPTTASPQLARVCPCLRLSLYAVFSEPARAVHCASGSATYSTRAGGSEAAAGISNAA